MAALRSARSYRPLAYDRLRPPSFIMVRRAEQQYARHLRSVARHIGAFVRSLFGDDRNVSEDELEVIGKTLAGYSAALRPWAEGVARKVLDDISRRDLGAWEEHTRSLGHLLREELKRAPIAPALGEALERQVALITSLPLEAAARVQNLALTGYVNGRRAGEIRNLAPSAYGPLEAVPEGLAKEIMRTGDVTVARANLIARTETSRIATELTKVRAEHVGSEGFIWRTARDADVRKAHRRLEGTFHRWNDPPVAEENGARHLPGAYPNCFPTDTPVDLRFGCRRLYRAFYDGPLIRLVVGAEIIECTPNHPILTPYGWVAADTLKSGDDIVGVVCEGARAGDYHEDKRKPTFGELYEALRTHGRYSVLRGGLNFHGDIIERDVDQITIDHSLPNDLIPGGFHQSREFPLAKPDGRVNGSGVVAGLDHIASSSRARGLNARDMRRRSFSSGNQAVSGLAVAQGYSIALQDSADGHSCDAVFLGYGRDPSAALVEGNNIGFGQAQSLAHRPYSFTDACIDPQRPELRAEDIGVAADLRGGVRERRALTHKLCRILDKGSRKFSGHVFTMETETGYYAVGASKILAKNCRCWAEPVIPANL